jgi:hypothetical protein
MKRDSGTGRCMTTGRGLASGSGKSFERVSSKGGEIVAVNTKRARKAFAGQSPWWGLNNVHNVARDDDPKGSKR